MKQNRRFISMVYIMPENHFLWLRILILCFGCLRIMQPILVFNILVDNRELYFVPVVNPDGYKLMSLQIPNGGGLWRKNRKVDRGRLHRS